MCGGTGIGSVYQCRTHGLSPRVRGNPHRRHMLSSPRGSIPACAGEPPGTQYCICRSRVYPRVCGGTPAHGDSPDGYDGLSPRVRGNRLRRVQGRQAMRSIPACAGEPQEGGCVGERGWVYPRVCGGTFGIPANTDRAQGLSPRVRGNPSWMGTRAPCAISIPACAGEPPCAVMCPSRTRVYPRVCGGTESHAEYVGFVEGLSPRVRGNPHA